MDQYTGFARVYDLFMDNVPYDEWTAYVKEVLTLHKIEPKTEPPIVCELGCGTGNVTRRLRDLGYDMIGIDISEEMLQIAQEKENNDGILYLCQDMREFELYGTVAAFVSVCDSMNYILEEEDLEQVFKLVNNYLDYDGLFIFDLHTPYYYREVLAEQTICENREEGSFIWENYYDPEEQINEFDMTIYYRDGKDSFKRCEETHYQRAYSLSLIKKLLKKSGLEVLEVVDAQTHEAAERDSERIYVVAQTTKKPEK